METARLILRELRADDAPTLVRELNNYNITRNTARIPYPYTMADAETYLDLVKTNPSQSWQRAIMLKNNGLELIGVIGVYAATVEKPAELGYWLSESVWGQGLGKEAAKAGVHYGFSAGGHSIISASYHNDNPASGRILLGLGFTDMNASSTFSLAQGKSVPVTNTRLTKEQWLTIEKGREL